MTEPLKIQFQVGGVDALREACTELARALELVQRATSRLTFRPEPTQPKADA